MKTTLNKIKDFQICLPKWEKLLAFLNKTEADNDELSLLTILESNGIEDALWALRAVEGYEKEKRLMACDFAESVVHLTSDERCVKAIKIARDYASGIATIEEMNDAADAACKDYSYATIAAYYATNATAAYYATNATAARAAGYATNYAIVADYDAVSTGRAACYAAYYAYDAFSYVAYSSFPDFNVDSFILKQIEIFKKYVK